jgi:hypothetical protein
MAAPFVFEIADTSFASIRDNGLARQGHGCVLVDGICVRIATI